MLDTLGAAHQVWHRANQLRGHTPHLKPLNQDLTPACVQWVECLPHGNGIMRVSRSCTCLGSFVQGVLCGPAIMVFLDGDLYVGHAKGGLRHGNGLLELADGTLYAGHFSQVRSSWSKLQQFDPKPETRNPKPNP